ncbi:erythroid differentiation-related factor 1-like, partial [Pteropus vampyrus]|uniref:Erythroid differentiation-related factor 1-like n=2 Tax=Pteropus vampyrus TaxID=132908 RepID=A0A6P6C5Q1_PTEVA
MTSQNSNVGKLKTLSGALDIMVRTKHAFQLIGRELVGELGQPKSEEAPPAADPSPSLNREEVIKLLSIFESRLSFLLLQSIKLLSSTKKKT